VGNSRCRNRAYPAHRGRLLLLEEPRGLAPVIVQQIGRTIAASAEGFTILLVEQNFRFAQA